MAPQLSKRQWEILELVSKGCSNPDIARLLDLSSNTVKTHLSNILKVLNVANRTEASVWFEHHHRPVVSQPLSLSVAGDSRFFKKGLIATLTQCELIQLTDNADKSCYQVTLVEENHQVQLQLRYQEHDGNSHQLWHGPFFAPEVDTQLQQTHYAALLVAKMVANHVTLLGQQPLTGSGFDTLYQIDHKLRHRSRSNLMLARQLLAEQLQQTPDWPLLHCYQVQVLYASLIEGYLEDVSNQVRVMANSAQIACNLAPDSALSQQAFAIFCMATSQFEQALTHVELALRYNPALEVALFMRSQLYGLTGQFERALESYDHYLAIFPQGIHSGRSLAGKALVNYWQGNYQEAKRLATSAMLFNQTIQMGLSAVMASIAVREQDQAAQQHWLQTLTTLNAEYPEQLNNMLKMVAVVMPAEQAQQFNADLQEAGILALIPRSQA